ncbi:hypothetical protein [Acetanaerobacterium elongatum]|uniref:DUF8091 domain-containing protein n=1 Tax=Acetanaerobacterium elongatum TaxID=258515 RepID=A0A1G9U675_9FIRM|nr:hypothetical protein [Acetanaerobacterium elongatum]SDM55055.1 hypothetical protein SAMN05192585_10180 [Acetanaerobacterium elongatum]
MDKQQFLQACKTVINASPVPGRGIGTLGEKTLHAILKHYMEPDTAKHEIKLGGYVADIASETGVIEVQTRNFNSLRSKLACFLEHNEVTVVYPIASTKWLVWVDPETGETTAKRRSPKRGNYCEVFYELYKIKPLLLHPRLKLCLMLIDMEEYRFLDGWSENKKRGSSRYNRIPTELIDELTINTPADYGRLIPNSLPEAFTAKDFAKAAKLSPKSAQTALNVLHSVGAVINIGKRGRSYLYQRLDNL